MSNVKYPECSQGFKKLIKSRHLNLIDLGVKSDISPYTIKKYVKGEVRPNISEFNDIAKGLNISKSKLYLILSPERTFGNFIRYIRYMHGLTTTKLGELCSIAQQTICRIEKSKRVPLTKMIRRIAQGLGQRPSALWTRYAKFNQHQTWLSVKVKGYILNHNWSFSEAQNHYHVSESYLKRAINGKVKPNAIELVKIAVGTNLQPRTVLKKFHFSNDYLQSYGFRLAKLLAVNNINSSQLAKKLHTSRQAISHYINNANQPNPDTKMKINHIFSNFRK